MTRSKIQEERELKYRAILKLRGITHVEYILGLITGNIRQFSRYNNYKHEIEMADLYHISEIEREGYSISDWQYIIKKRIIQKVFKGTKETAISNLEYSCINQLFSGVLHKTTLLQKLSRFQKRKKEQAVRSISDIGLSVPFQTISPVQTSQH